MIEFDKKPSVTMSYPMPCCVIPDTLPSKKLPVASFYERDSKTSPVSESRNEDIRQAERMTAYFCTDETKCSPDSEQKEPTGAKRIASRG